RCPLGKAGACETDGGAEPRLVWPDARRREPLRRQKRGGQLRELVRLDGLDLGDHALEREELGVGHERLPEPAHAVRGGFEREDDPSLEVLLRALELALAQPPGGDLADLLDTDLDARGEVLLAGADVDAEDA